MKAPHLLYVLVFWLAVTRTPVLAQTYLPKKDGTVYKVDIEQLKHDLEQEKKLFVGSPLPPFSAITSEGRQLNNGLMAGKVYLLVMFYPDCRCFEPKGLKAVTSLEEKHKDFRVMAVLQDTTYLYAYRQDNAEPLFYAVTSTREQTLELRLHNSAPVYVLVDRKGLVVKILASSDIMVLNKSEEEQAELAKVVEEVLLRY